MNLSQRERILAGGVGLVLLLFVGNYFWESIRKGFDSKNNEILNLTKQRDDQKLQVTAGAIAKSKLNRLVSQSLPSNEEKARAQYLEWLIKLADECELIDPLPKSMGDSVEKDLYQSFRFQLSGTGTIENATKLLHAFHAKDYLHRVLRFDMQPLPNSKIPNQLKIALDCEVLALKNAKPEQPAPAEMHPDSSDHLMNTKIASWVEISLRLPTTLRCSRRANRYRQLLESKWMSALLPRTLTLVKWSSTSSKGNRSEECNWILPAAI